MVMVLKRIYFTLIIVLLTISVHGQTCYGFHTFGDCRITRSEGFQTYGQSRSALLEIRKTATFKAVFYGQRDYRVLFCTNYAYYPIHVVISNADTKEILFDNVEDDYIESVGFSIDKTQNLIFEVTILADKIDPEDSDEIRVCAGVSIYWKKVPKIGF